jgi:integrase
MVEEYFNKYSMVHKKPNTQKSDRNIIKNYINPYIGMQLICDLNLRNMQDFYDAVAQKISASTANHAFRVMSHFWNWCEKNEYLGLHTNPCGRVTKRKPIKIKRPVLDKTGYGQLIEALNDGLAGKSPYDIRAFIIIKLIALTGSRTSEISQLKKCEVKLENTRLDLLDSKTGPKEIPLCAAAVVELQRVMSKSNSTSEFVFPSRRAGVNKGLDPRKAFEWALGRSGLPRMRKHDLRHSFVSMGLDIGENILAISEAVGHSSPNMTRHYGHLLSGRLDKSVNNIGDAITGVQQ